jgi:GDP-L-fucose synthase
LYAQHTQPLQSHINVGSGSDVTIAELAQTISQTVGYTGQIEFDATKPDGTPRKLLDTSRLEHLGWSAPTSLDEGLRRTYEWYVHNESSTRAI